MKKLIIVNNNLEIGGVQTSLINLLKEIHADYEITLLLFHEKEGYRALLPSDVRIETVKSPIKHLGMSKKDTKGRPLRFLSRAIWVTLTRLLGRRSAVRLMLLFQKRYRGYDYAVSYLHEHAPKLFYGGCNEFVLYKIDADKKVTWLHCDFTLCGADARESLGLYQRFDTIVACSEGAKKAFLSVMPECSDRTVAVRNCHDYDRIRTLAGNGISYPQNRINLLTVARLSEEKGIDRALRAVQYATLRGVPITYHIVGGGIEEERLKRLTKELALEDSVVFYGNQSNPYPYMKNADLFLLTSYHEAAPMVFDEAAFLGLPVLATATTSTDEMLVESEAGIVVENDGEAINEALYALLTHPERLQTIRQALQNKQYSCIEQRQKLHTVLPL